LDNKAVEVVAEIPPAEIVIEDVVLGKKEMRKVKVKRLPLH
jgi:hypothetical protein